MSSPTPAYATQPTPTRRTYGAGVAELAALMGRPLMPWQQQVVDVALEVDDDGLFVYPSVCVTVPRQSGKTLMVGAVAEHRAMTTRLGRVWLTMQTGRDARDWFLHEHAPMLAALDGLFTFNRGAGNEAIRWLRGGRGSFRPFNPTVDALHGKQSDLVVVDEAWSFDPIRGRELDQAIVPTQATRPGAQVWKISTAGTDMSTWLLGSVESGRAAVTADKRVGTAYFEWSCPDNLDPTLPESWPSYHPAYGRTITAKAMLAALEMLGPEEFSRAYGNKWLHTTARVIPLALWLEAARADQTMPQPGKVALGFDVALDRSDACIVAAYRDEHGVARVEVAEHQAAAGWVASRLAELCERWRPIAVSYDEAGPAVDVADQARRAGLDLVGLKAADYAASCSSLLQGLLDHKVTYRPHGALDQAAAAAGRRQLGDRWAWGRRQAAVSIAALVAGTVAVWAFDHAPEPVGPFKVF